jgi:siroheme synthase (precorrin-2 oxidase/ferrochelatase)
VVQEMTVAVHSDGCSCNKSRALRDRIADWLNDENE